MAPGSGPDGMDDMFLALRDIRFAKGRFLLMTGVVTLVTLLLVVLSALTRGLGQQSTSALESLPVQGALLAPSGDQLTWADSVVEAPTVEDLRTAVPGSEPLVVGRARMQVDGRTAQVAVTGLDPRGATARAMGLHLADGQVLLPDEVADGLAPGQEVELNGSALTIGGTEATRWYSHAAVAWTTTATANQLSHAPKGQATAMLVPEGADMPATSVAGLEPVSGKAMLDALTGYNSERGSLVMIQGFLYGITALVVITFLSVWTIQRTRDIAVLRAMGASGRYVLGDSLGQAAILLAVGAIIGGLAGSAVALAVKGTVPVQVVAATTLLPTLGVALIGLAGSVLATRRVTAVDPLLALGGN